jgi:CheY-like chemotaxis protein
VIRENPTPKRLKVINPSKQICPTPSVVGKRSAAEADDDDVVSVRSQALRAPLESMVVFADLVASGDVTEEQRQLYAASLLREGRRLAAQINNALSLQRLEAGQRDLDLAPVDIRSLIHRAVVAAGEDERLPIDVRVPEHLPLVSADAEAILEVLANFLSNARAFSPGGGAIIVESRAAGDMVEVSIRDHGVGVESKALPKLFRKFYRADSGVRRRGPGAGLGLAINLRIIEAHGGQVKASSKGRGRGARFMFTLPVARRVTGSGYVLIVEDDAAFARLLKAEFASVGLDTLRAADAETAQQMLVDTTPRAIVLDLWLPGLQGEDFLARMPAGFGTRLPVVVLTAKNLKPAELSALEKSGAMAVLPKEAGAPQAAAALIAEALAFDLVVL